MFNQKDVGCYVDGTFGEDHLCEVLASLITDGGIIEDLSSDDPYIRNEAVEDALVDLQANTEPGLHWELSAGDLCLVIDEEGEDDELD